MNNKLLLSLRKNGSERYNSPDRLLVAAGSILDNLDRVPWISGHEQMNQWDIRYSPPRTIADRLTVENFMEGLKDIDEAYSKNPAMFKKFGSFISINSVEPGYPQLNLH